MEQEKKEITDLLKEKNEKIPSQNLFFKQDNFIKEIKNKENSNEKFDVITCLNVSKWIHLNFGDNAIKLLFLNVYNLLEENGIFIFQFQNWKSYKKRKTLSDHIHKNFINIKLRPEKFEEYLNLTYNFKIIKKISTTDKSNEKYDDRPIYILQK